MVIAIDRPRTIKPVALAEMRFLFDKSIEELRTVSEGARYPVTKQDLIVAAVFNRATDSTVDLLQALPDIGYFSFNDIADRAWELLLI